MSGPGESGRREEESIHGERQRIAHAIQHTLVGNAVTHSQLKRHLDECLVYGFNAAMIPPFGVPYARERLESSGIKIASWVDFPQGTSTTTLKVWATKELVGMRVDEIDLMPNVGLLLGKDIDEYARQVRSVVEAADGTPVKIMLELPILPRDMWETVVGVCVEAGVACVKNASGGAVGMATPEVIRFLKEYIPQKVCVKASGGIRTREQAISLLDAGADLLGTSSALAIMSGVRDGGASASLGAQPPSLGDADY